MQPYFFPYIGYWQLIGAVDCFVVYDDVQFIKGGWINRNQILSQGRPLRITLPLVGASPNRRIHEITVSPRIDKVARTIRQSYARAPCFESVIRVVDQVMTNPDLNLARFLSAGLQTVSGFLSLCPTWILSSAIADELPPGRGQERVLSICEHLGASQYVNLPGGRSLYDPAAFRERGIRLSFLEPGPVEYRQAAERFVPNLSIIDVMMNNSIERTRMFLEEHALD